MLAIVEWRRFFRYLVAIIFPAHNFNSLDLTETVSKFKSLKKSAHQILMVSLERAIWNWMDTYPEEFAEVQVIHLLTYFSVWMILHNFLVLTSFFACVLIGFLLFIPAKNEWGPGQMCRHPLWYFGPGSGQQKMSSVFLASANHVAYSISCEFQFL